MTIATGQGTQGNEEQLYHMSTGTPSCMPGNESGVGNPFHPILSNHALKNHMLPEDVCAHSLQDLH